jgi:hypothetical protein
MLNCTVSRMGRPSNPDNGRVVDDRGNPMDSIVIENNTWYNITSRMIRDGGGVINYIRMNQNTLVNGGQRFSSFGPVNQLIITNNIIANPRFIGNTITSDLVSTDFSPSGSNPVINFNNNNIYFDPEVEAVWDEITATGSERLKPPFVAPVNQSYLNAATGLLDEPLTFTLRPTPPIVFIRELELGSGSSIQDWVWSNAVTQTPWELADIAYHNFSYPQATQSFSGSSKGEPLGDLRWFPSYDIPWTLLDMAQQADILIDREQSLVLEGNAAALLTLQNEIANARAVAANSGATGLQLGTARQQLEQAMINFRASIIITSRTSEDLEVDVYPNPATDFVIVKGLTEPAVLSIRNAMGNQLKTIITRQESEQIYVNDLPAGLYLITVETNTGVVVKKISKL